MNDNENKTNAPTIKLPDLLPCPFCGYEASITEVESAGRGGRITHIVGCNSEDCDVSFHGHARKIDAANAWNERAEMPKHVYWGAGEADCPREIKAANGELHTLRCKLCGIDRPKGFCRQGVPALNEADALRAEVEGYRRALQNLVHTVEKSSLIAAVWMGSGRRDAEIEQIVGAKNIAIATLKEYAAIKPNAAAGEEGTE